MFVCSQMDQQIMFGFIVERGKKLFINVFSWVGSMVEFFFQSG